MKNSRYKELIAYACSFVSFVLPKIDVDEIILFGSSVRGEATKDSDIDLFFNIKNNEENTKSIIKRELGKFYKSKSYEIWSLKGIKHSIAPQVGNLDKWNLKRSIISEGIVLYGKYKGMPEKTKGFVHFNIKPIKDIAKRNKVTRILFGRTEKTFKTEGLVKTFGGKKLSPTSFFVPIEHVNDILKIFNAEKLDFSFFEFWSDQL